MERDAAGQPLRRLLMCGFLQSLPVVEDNDEDAYLPLGDTSQALLVQARSAYADYIANHDAGDAAVGATPGATHNDGYDADGGGPPDDAQGASHSAPPEAEEDGPGAAPTPSALSKSQPTSRRRRPKAATSSTATTTRPKKPRQPTKMERAYSKEALIAVFISELRVAVDLDARMGGDDELEGGCVHGANVIGFVEAFDPICVWTALLKGKVTAFCSCGGVMGSGSAATVEHALEHVEIQWKRKMSSTCRHAAALLAAYRVMSAELSLKTPEALVSAMPVLRGPDVTADGKPDDKVVHVVGMVGRRMNIPLYAVCYDNIWSPAIVRPGGNRYKLATCCLLSCQTQPWGCPHAKAVNKFNRVEASTASEAAAAAQEALRFGPNGVLNEMGDPPPVEPVAAAPTAAAVPPPPPRPRRARNMFPCTQEVALCDVYSKFVDEARTLNNIFRYDSRLHVEEKCIVCQEPRGESLSSQSIALLFTIRGRMQILVGQWVCANGHEVLYDGAGDGLFAATLDTVYSRIFLDLVLELCVIARSTMAAACQYLTALLRNTAAYGEGEPGQARQLLSDAAGEFSDTLVVPAAAFKCHLCGQEEAAGGPFKCIVCDGQMLSVLQAHVKEMIRPSGNAPRVDFSILFACAIRKSSMRGLVRRRVRAKPDEAVELTIAESRAWPQFAAASDEPPPQAPPLPTADGVVQRAPIDDERALTWSTAQVVKHFFAFQGGGDPGAPAVQAAPAAAVDPPLHIGANEDGATSADEYEDADLMSGEDDSGSDNDDSGNDEDATDSADAEAGSGDSVGAATDGGSSRVAQEDAAAPAEETSTSDGSPSSSWLPGDGASAMDDTVPPVSRFPSAPPPATRSGSSSSSSSPPPTRRRRDTAVAARAARRTRQSRRRPAARVGTDAWHLVEGEVEEVPAGERASEDPVAIDRADPLSPLTLRAIKATADVIVPPSDGVATVLVKIGPIPLQMEDFQLTLPSQWFNDELVNAYVELLRVRQIKFASSVRPKPQYIFFNSFFYDKLVEKGRYDYNAVRRWTRKEVVLKANKIFIPVNVTDAHWFLAVVIPAAGLVELYDSLGRAQEHMGRNIARWTKQEAAVHGLPKKQWKVVTMPCRAQENCDDCGVFTCRHMELMSKGESVIGWGGSSSYHRRRIAAELLSGSL